MTKAEEQLPDSVRIQNADHFFASLPAVIKHGGDRAFYSPAGDFIQLPVFEQFKSPEGYVSTMCHELGHNAGFRIMPRRCCVALWNTASSARHIGIIRALPGRRSARHSADSGQWGYPLA